jgi:hypothetical protein
LAIAQGDLVVVPRKYDVRAVARRDSLVACPAVNDAVAIAHIEAAAGRTDIERAAAADDVGAEDVARADFQNGAGGERRAARHGAIVQFESAAA